MKVRNKFHIELTKELIEQVEKELKIWEEEGQFVFGVDPECSLDNLPEWFDIERFKKAQLIIKDIQTSVSLSSLIGLLFVVQLPKGLGPLLATGQSKNTSSLFSRYLSTILHVHTWYTKDPFEEGSKSAKSIRMVRSMHKRVGIMMNNKYSLSKFEFKPESLNTNGKLTLLDKETNELNRTPLWVNQWDMLLTQWAFIGPLILEPYTLGVHGHSPQTLEQIMYLWRCIGHFIGINPKFNLFTDCDYALGYARCKRILEKVYAPSITQLSSPTGARMSIAIVKGIRYYNPYLSWPAVMNRAYTMFNIDAKRLNHLVEVDKAKIEAEKQGKVMVVNDSELQQFGQYKNEWLDENGNPLNDQQKKEQLSKAGYNDKYEVWVWDGLPIERVKLLSNRDRFMSSLLNFQLSLAFKWPTMRAFSRKAQIRRNYAAQKKRKNLQQTCSETYDQNWQFDKCPFAAGFGTVEYEEFEKIINN